MNWKTYYQEHLTTAEGAVKKIKSGDRVVVAHACGEPSHLLEAMVANADAYRNVEIVHMVAMGKGEYCNQNTLTTSATTLFSWAEAPGTPLPRGGVILPPASSSRFHGSFPLPCPWTWLW